MQSYLRSNCGMTLSRIERSEIHSYYKGNKACSYTSDDKISDVKISGLVNTTKFITTKFPPSIVARSWWRVYSNCNRTIILLQLVSTHTVYNIKFENTEQFRLVSFKRCLLRNMIYI